MLKPRHVGAACLAVLTAACASGPSSYSQPAPYSSRTPTTYYGDTAYSDYARVVAIDLERAAGERYRITVRLRDGREATYVQNDRNGIRVGDRVRVEGDHLALG